MWEMTWEYHDGRATNAGASSSALVLSSCRSKMPPKGETMTSGDVWVVCRRTHSMRHEDLARFESEGEARAYAADQPGTSQNAGDHRSLFLIRRGSNGSEEMIELGRTT